MSLSHWLTHRNNTRNLVAHRHNTRNLVASECLHVYRCQQKLAGKKKLPHEEAPATYSTDYKLVNVNQKKALTTGKIVQEHNIFFSQYLYPQTSSTYKEFKSIQYSSTSLAATFTYTLRKTERRWCSCFFSLLLNTNPLFPLLPPPSLPPHHPQQYYFILIYI